MAKHTAVDERSRLVLLAGTVGVLIAVAIGAMIVVTRGSDQSGPRGSRADGGVRATGAPATSAPASARSTAVSRSSATPSTSPVALTRSTGRSGRKPITYTVKPGDNLSGIAQWFKLRGYGDLYERNKAVIGADPDLIRPGQKITVSSDGMAVSSTP